VEVTIIRVTEFLPDNPNWASTHNEQLWQIPAAQCPFPELTADPPSDLSAPRYISKAIGMESRLCLGQKAMIPKRRIGSLGSSRGQSCSAVHLHPAGADHRIDNDRRGLVLPPSQALLL